MMVMGTSSKSAFNKSRCILNHPIIETPISTNFQRWATALLANVDGHSPKISPFDHETNCMTKIQDGRAQKCVND